MEENKMTAQESLEVITSMINRTKERYFGNGNILLMWGCLVTIITIMVWILLAITRQQSWNWIWFAIPLIGCPATFIMARKERRVHGVTTYSDKITSHLWAIFGISEIALTLICLGFTLIGGVDCWIALLVYSILIAPTAEIAQGLIVREKCLICGGIVGLTVGIITLCCVSGRIPLSINWYMPLFILAWVAMMLIPGIVLNYKARHHERT